LWSVITLLLNTIIIPKNYTISIPELKLLLPENNQDSERSVIDQSTVTPVSQSMVEINQNYQN